MDVAAFLSSAKQTPRPLMSSHEPHFFNCKPDLRSMCDYPVLCVVATPPRAEVEPYAALSVREISAGRAHVYPDAAGRSAPRRVEFQDPGSGTRDVTSIRRVPGWDGPSLRSLAGFPHISHPHILLYHSIYGSTESVLS